MTRRNRDRMLFAISTHPVRYFDPFMTSGHLGRQAASVPFTYLQFWKRKDAGIGRIRGALFLYPININYFRFVPLELESVKIRDYLRPHLPRSFFKGETDFCHRLIIK